MSPKLRQHILNAIWSSQPGRLGLKKSDYVFHLRQNKNKRHTCVVWFAHRTDHDEICTILDDDTLGESTPDPVALFIDEVGYMPNPRTSDDWEFPIETEASMEMTTESMVYHYLAENCS